MSATAKETIRNQVMRFADPADMDVGNWDICTDNILAALDEAGFAIVPKGVKTLLDDLIKAAKDTP